MLRLRRAAATEESTVVHEGPRGAAARAGLADSFDDKEGYYTFTVRARHTKSRITTAPAMSDTGLP